VAVEYFEYFEYQRFDGNKHLFGVDVADRLREHFLVKVAALVVPVVPVVSQVYRS